MIDPPVPAAPAAPAAAGGAAGGAPHRRPALSPSRAGDFKQCPLLYRLRAIDRLPERPTPAQVRGTLVHAVLERLYERPAAARTPQAARELVGPTWELMVEREPGVAAQLFAGPHDPELVAFLVSAGPLLESYFRLEDPRAVEPEACELLVEVELSPELLLRGYVDRLDPGPAVVDYKTGAVPREGREARALFAMKFYALALLLQRGVVPAELRLLYLADEEVLTYAPDEAELRRFARTLEAIWAAVRTAARTGDFRPSPGPACGWCSFREVCPAYGGTPPPYPGWPEVAA